MRLISVLFLIFLGFFTRPELAWCQAKSKNSKSAKASSKKTVSKTQKIVSKRPDPSEYNLVNLASFTAQGNTYETTLPALLLSDRSVAVQIDSRNTLEDLSLNSRVFVTSPTYVQLFPLDYDSASRWVLLKSDQKLPIRAAHFAAKLNAQQISRMFHYDDVGQWLRDAAAMKARAHETRSPASLNTSAAAVIERKIQSFGDRFAEAFQSPMKRLTINNLSLAPEVTGLNCHAASPIIESEAAQSFVANATAIKCQYQDPMPYSPNFDLALRLQVGMIKIKNGQNQTDASRIELLQNLAAKEVSEVKQLSTQIKYSTPTICETSHLTDKNVDVYFCTRSLRGFRSLNDSVVIMGRSTGQSYVYNMVRASGIGSDSTQRIIQANLGVLGANP